MTNPAEMTVEMIAELITEAAVMITVVEAMAAAKAIMVAVTTVHMEPLAMAVARQAIAAVQASMAAATTVPREVQVTEASKTAMMTDQTAVTTTMADAPTMAAVIGTVDMGRRTLGLSLVNTPPLTMRQLPVMMVRTDQDNQLAVAAAMAVEDRALTTTR